MHMEGQLLSDFFLVLLALVCASPSAASVGETRGTIPAIANVATTPVVMRKVRIFASVAKTGDFTPGERTIRWRSILKA